MLGIVFIACIAQLSRSIIVKDSPLSGIEYKYAYDIEDFTTGDTKSLHEVRLGDIVTGAYTVLDPDGTRRTVHYTADPKQGFKAIDNQEPVLDGLVFREPSLEYPYEALFDEYTMDPDVSYAPISLAERPRHYFTPANELIKNRRPDNRHYFTPNRD